MKKYLSLIAAFMIGALLFTQNVEAQRSNAFSTKALRELSLALTDDVDFGVPRYTTALLPACDTASRGAVAFDTTTGGLTVCNGTAWSTATGSAITCGSTTATCTFTFPLTATGGADIAASFQATADLSAADTLLRMGDAGSATLFQLFGNGTMTIAGSFNASATGSMTWATRTAMSAPADGSRRTTNAASTADTDYIHGTAKTLTDNSATTFARVAIADDTSAVVCLFYQVDAENATDQQTIGGMACVPIINDAGAETCGTIVEAGEANTTSTGTITSTITCTGAGTATIDLALTSDSSLNVSPLLKWQARLGSSAGVTITPQ